MVNIEKLVLKIEDIAINRFDFQKEGEVIDQTEIKSIQGGIRLFKKWMSRAETLRGGEHITDIYITETGTTELENLSHNIIDIFIIET